MTREVLLRSGKLGELAEYCNCSKQLVMDALKFRSNSRKARHIRCVALNKFNAILYEG